MKLFRILFLILLPVTASASSTLADVRTNQAKYDYLMKINSSAIAVVDSNVVVSLQITAIQDVPATQ